MSQIGALQIQLSGLKRKQQELEQEEKGLIAFQKENTHAAGEMDIQIIKKSKYADEFYGLKSRTTIAVRLGDIVARRYGSVNRKRVSINYQSIGGEIEGALKQVRLELAQCKLQVMSTEIRIRQQQAAESQQQIQGMEG